MSRHDRTQSLDGLGSRERQIMHAVFRRGTASVAEVRAELADPPSYSSVRTMLRYLESKGLLRHEVDGRTYVYSPTITRTAARKTALRSIVTTFFGGSKATAVAALMDVSDANFTDDDLARLKALIARRRRTEAP